MSLAIKAARGAIWNIGVGIGSRLIGVVGTIVLAQLLDPSVIGEVLVAAALVMSAGTLSHIGFGQFIVAKKATREQSFHITVFTLSFLALALTALWLFRYPLTEAFDAPGAARYIPALAFGTFVQRMGGAVSRILTRDLHFRAVAVARGVSELVYSGVAVGLAAAGWGGDAIAVAFVIRGVVQGGIYIAVTDRREWLQPCKLRWSQTVEIFRFGIPLWIAAVAHFAARQWDNLLISRFFGPHELGIYNYAYNLADIPATQVGEHIGDVLLPSFGKLSDDVRRAALVRATTLMALLVFPLAVGLGAISETLISIIFNDKWQQVAPVLLILSALSIVRPVSWTINSYLLALHCVRSVMVLEVMKIVTLLAAIVIAGPYGLTWICVGVGVAFGINAVGNIIVVRYIDTIRVDRLLLGMLGPLLACVPMAGAVYGVRIGLASVDAPAIVSLAAEIAAGGIAYIAGAFVVARPAALDFISLVRKSLSRRH